MASLVLPCPSCTALNRLPPERLGDRPVCSTCRHALLGEVVELDADSFDRVTGKTTLPVLVDFWAGWCSPCRMMAPHFAAAARHLVGQAVLAKVDTEAAPAIAARFAIQSIPTLVLLDGGKEVGRHVGAMNEAQIVQWATAPHRD